MTVRVAVRGPDPLISRGLSSGLAAFPGLVVGDQDPETVVFDLGPSPPSGLPFWPTEAVPVLALSPSSADAEAALRRGAKGVLFRDGDPLRIGAAVQAVAAGMRVVDDSFAGGFFPAGTQRPVGPSPRERQVLELLVEGNSNKEIASKLSMSEHTAKFHVNAVMEKLGAQSRTEAVVLAVRRGWLNL